MAKEYWYFIAGVLVVLLPVVVVVAVKKLNLQEGGPDARVIYSREGPHPLSLHVFHAQSDADTRPALLLLHGGRWLYGRPQNVYHLCRYFAARGISCFAAQYRLGADNRPDVRGAIADTNAAFSYLVEHAKEFGIDPQRIAAAGSSAGGHLAAALGTGIAIGPGDTWTVAANRPAALLLYNPMLDLSPGTPDHHLVKDYWRAVSPLHHIDAVTPPTLVLSGTLDPEVPVETVEEYCEAMEGVGGHCEAALYEGQSHGFFNRAPWFERTGARAMQFLEALAD